MARWKGVFNKQGIVGLDMGSCTIKAVQVEPTRTGWRLLQIAQCPTPSDSIRDGVIVQPEEIANAIKRLLRENGFRASVAVTAIAGASVIVRQVTLPKMTEAMLRKTIRYEASKYVSTSIEDSYIGFEILGDVDAPQEAENEQPEKQMHVLLVVAPREMVDAQIRTLEMAGLEAAAIEVEAFALYRALLEINRVAMASSDAPVAIADIGAESTNIYIVSKDGFFLTRTIPIAGDAFTQTVQSLLHCSWSEAERFKRTVDLRHLLKRRSSRSRASAGEDETVQDDASSAQEEAVLKALQGQVDELLREVRRSLHYYQSQFPEGSPLGQVGKIITTGGSSQLSGFAEYASARLGLEVEPGDPFNNPDFDTAHISAEALQMFAPVLGIAVGLAVREAFAEYQRHAA